MSRAIVPSLRTGILYVVKKNHKKVGKDVLPMKCLIIDAVHSSISEELGKYMQVDTKMLPSQEELASLIPDYDCRPQD